MNEIASRYGQALFSLANELNKVNEWQEEVKELKNVLKKNDDFVMVLESPFLLIEERISMVDKVLVDVTDEIKSLIKLLIKNNRISLIYEVLSSFNSYCNESRGVEEGLIYSTIPLDEPTLLKIQEKISNRENTKIELINRIDPSLIGGVKVVVNNHIYDGSIKNHLEMMRTDLLKKEGN